MKKFFTVLLTAGLLIGTVNAAETDKTGAVILGISPDTKTITIQALTADSSAIQVEGSTVKEMPSGKRTVLTVTGKTVTLKGAITALDCSGNQLTSLDISGLTALRKLNCSDNQLTSLNVQSLTALEKLECSENRLTSLDVRNLTMLWALFCDRNRLTSLNVQGLSALKILSCFSNELTSLDMQGLTVLDVLDCSANRLTALNVEPVDALQGLMCSSNQLTELNLQNLSSLRILGCTGNKLAAIELPAVNVLQELHCYNNNLKEEAFIRILNALPGRKQDKAGKALMYTEKRETQEKNITDFTSSAKLKTAFETAQAKNWEFFKRDTNGWYEKI